MLGDRDGPPDVGACDEQARSRQWLVRLLAAAIWWPRARDGLLARAERSAESARRALHRQRVDEA